jgi:hypothetical protein
MLEENVMGLFDKKKKGRDDFDSPVEHVDLSAPTTAVLDDDAGHEADDAETVDLSSSPAPDRLRGAIAATRSPESRRARTSPGTYGIDDAIALMRTLPSENIELVVQVVKQTLESARIDIPVIIDDASAKLQRIDGRIAVLRDAIAELEREIDTRRAEIDQLEAENRETTRVKERLMLAEKLAHGGRPDTVVEAHGGGSAAGRGPSVRSKPPSSPPPPPGSSSPPGNPGHVASGSHMAAPGAAAPGGGAPIGAPPAGSFGHKTTGTHTVISKK